MKDSRKVMLEIFQSSLRQMRIRGWRTFERNELIRNHEGNPVEDWRTYQETLITSLPPSCPSLVSSTEIDSTSSFVAAKISVPPPLSFTFLPMEIREEPFARSAVPVSRAISLKSARSRPSARWGGLCLRPVAM